MNTWKVRFFSWFFSLYKILKGIKDQPEERDESPHPYSDHVLWNESYYFNFTDPRNGIGGFTRIGMLPNQKLGIGILFIFTGGNEILHMFQTIGIDGNPEKKEIGLIHYEILVPLKTWRIRTKGKMLRLSDPGRISQIRMLGGEDLSFVDADIDITFNGMAPCFDFKAIHPRAFAEMIVAKGTTFADLRKVSKIASSHYEQAGLVHGGIIIDGRRIEIYGSGHRDHSWGIRDWRAPKAWTWITCQFKNSHDDYIAFNMSRVHIDTLEIFNGFVVRGGHNYPLRRSMLETEFESDGITQKRIRCEIEDVGGVTLVVEGRVKTVVPLLLEEGGHKTLINEALTEFRWGDHSGFGISEYLHQVE